MHFEDKIPCCREAECDVQSNGCSKQTTASHVCISLEKQGAFKMAMGFEPIPRPRITLFARSVSPMINSAVGGVLKRLPLLRRTLGGHYARMLEEKRLGSRWWE